VHRCRSAALPPIFSPILKLHQSAFSKLESQEDIMVRTLEKYIQALGGELEVRAKFPDRTVTLKQFTQGAEIRPH
jgi:hypothetical protein